MRKAGQWLAIVLITATAGTAMAAATVDVFKERDQAMLAGFSNTQPIACNGVPDTAIINASVDVQWNSSLIKSDGTTTSSALLLTLRYTNTCTNDDITMSGFVFDAN